MTDFVTAITTATHALKLVSDLKEIDVAFDKADLKVKMANLMEMIADLKGALVQAKDELRNKDEEIRVLGDNFQVLKETVEIAGFHYDKKQDGSPRGVPYCPVCIQKEGYMFRMTTVFKEGRPLQCPSCKAEYQGAARYTE